MPRFLWTQKQDIGPKPRVGHAMAFDSARNRVVLFGGVSATSALMKDTWEWDGQEWTQQEDIGPPARKAHAMAYDAARGRMVLFGGDSGSGSGLGYTWEWDGTTWMQVADFGPDACLAAAMVFKGDRVALYGGVDSTNSSPPPRVFGNTWEWDGKHWTGRQDIGPGPRWCHAMSYDSTNGRIVLFGGLPIFAPAGDPTLPDRLLGDTWQHSEGPTPSDTTAHSDIRVQSLLLAGDVHVPNSQATATVRLATPAPPGSATVRIRALSARVVQGPTPPADASEFVGPAQEQEIGVPAQVVVPAGSTTTEFVVSLGNLARRDYLIVASAGNSARTAPLLIAGPGALQLPCDVSPSSLPATPGQQATVTTASLTAITFASVGADGGVNLPAAAAQLVATGGSQDASGTHFTVQTGTAPIAGDYLIIVASLGGFIASAVLTITTITPVE